MGADIPPSTVSKFLVHDDHQGIDIRSWRIESRHDCIASTNKEEQLARQLDIKLPGMLFPDNYLRLSYPQANPAFQLCFSAVDALKMVGEADPAIQVKAADRWKKKGKRNDVEITTIESASDWTFSTKYPGTVSIDGRHVSDLQETPINTSHASIKTASLTDINYDALRDTSVPILYSSEIILFEDELDDNGTASYKVRIRVMPDCYFILARFFLRVDGVLIRISDTRYYHQFGTNIVIRESVMREASLTTMLRDVHPSLLTKPDQVAEKVPVSSRRLINIILEPPQ